MATIAHSTAVHVDGIEARAYKIPTATDHESDGTLVWDSTSIVVVEIEAGGKTGLGYTYCHPAAAQVIESKLASIVEQGDPLMPQRIWANLQVQARQLGHAGIAAMAISAVDIALWDLKAKLLDCCLADALPRFRESVPIYASGGFTNYSDDQLRDQVRTWTDEGHTRTKIKVGRDKPVDPARIDILRSVAGPNVEVMVDGNGGYTPQEALLWAERFKEQGVSYFEEPVSSQDLAGLAEIKRRAPAGMAIAAGEYGWNLPYFHRMLEAGAVHIVQADVTRCGGITNLLRIDGLCKSRNLAFSAHCAPAVSAHACCAMETVVHLEYFFDHHRIERMLFAGTLDPSQGVLTPERSRPGLGLELRRDEAERYRVSTGGEA
ncbi:MAG TPA: enolase C-terminal domain-like protein [Solirubrobacteraceae bacterium]|nr:enolase C-terminal domain-like protein [Solirubrobacteraceae bacterium]